MSEEYTNTENYYQEFDIDNSIIEVDNISNLYNENIEEEAVPEIIQSIEDTTNDSTVIEKIFKYIKSPIREDSAEIIESMIELSSSLESMSVESIELSKLLSESEKIKLDLLKEMGRRGLDSNSYPIGKAKKEQINPVAFVFETDTKLNSKLKNFGTLLEELVTNSDLEFKKNVIKEKKEFEELGIDIKKYVLTQQQKKGYFQILTFEDDRLTRTELNFMLNFMKNSNFKNKTILKEREEFYKFLLNDKKVDFPDTRELIKDVTELKGILNHKLEDLPEILTANERENFKNFLPALDEYYKDQINALSGGKSFVPLAKNLKEIQKEINENPNVKNLVDSCEVLGYSQQRLYILHWIAESLMKEKYNATLGNAINEYSRENPSQKSKYQELRKAVWFRNDIAHNGLLWNPEDFEIHIKSYEDGIKFISEDLNINLERYRLKKQDRTLSRNEKEDILVKTTNLKIENINNIDINLINNIDTIKHKRLVKLTSILNERNIRIDEFVENNLGTIKYFYNNSGDEANEEFKRQVRVLNEKYFKNKFANTYFSMDYDELIKKALIIRTNVDKWLFKMAMMNKEDKLTSLEIEELKKFRDKLNGR